MRSLRIALFACGFSAALVGAFAFRKRDREHARVRMSGPGLALRW